ncbi:PIN/TRAM domain-containing protein [Oceanobacillus alkalisoli]|uniref:PIN/TRAM domain-containing protein n=1 Tax=Oceanobacillus alkalisoli TaxID=2925113 RepID=UPI001EF03C6E|nr:PIN/TRAM domain-containing protein [Oceanobacillus alkalisoli]MCF3943848.1 PIN/TRAM domain-containing protein [Oceanobacillus alkalisoli]MCG5104647.1 PIN/TRAM domain-containing protein [Oceanobacillus alkalisoli]
MLKKVVHIFFIVLGGTIGYLYIPMIINLLNIDMNWLTNPYLGMTLGAIILFLLSSFFVDHVVNFFKWIEDTLIKLPAMDLLFGSLGMIVGLVIAYLVTMPLQDINIQVFSQVLPIFITIILGYLGFRVGFRRREEFSSLLRTGKKDKLKETTDQGDADSEDEMPKPKILDTSVIIDGRIADICSTGFLEGTLVIPQFVLGELQHIADSSDALKRNRGRRGLDVLNRIQKELPITVEIYEGDFEEIAEVDSKLIKLAKVTDGIVVTNDFNLNKVCDLQRVPVLNINDLANAVKPVVLPGEELVVQVIKDGKEQRQGIAYLDDGTMIVVEEGRDYIGKTIEVIITSVLQTSAGRMIFAKPKTLEKAL